MARVGGNPDIYGYKKDYYTDKVLPKWEMIGAWARSGVANGRIAKNLGIADTTFKRYMEEHEELSDYIRECREDADVQVENALWRRALGYTYEEVTRERKMNEDGEYKMVVSKKVQKHERADVVAAQYWLEHRAMDRWARNPVAGINSADINTQIAGLAALIANPVPVRAIGSESE